MHLSLSYLAYSMKQKKERKLGQLSIPFVE